MLGWFDQSAGFYYLKLRYLAREVLKASNQKNTTPSFKPSKATTPKHICMRKECMGRVCAGSKEGCPANHLSFIMLITVHRFQISFHFVLEHFINCQDKRKTLLQKHYSTIPHTPRMSNNNLEFLQYNIFNRVINVS